MGHVPYANLTNCEGNACTRVWRGQWWTAGYRSSSSIAPKDRRRTRCWKLCVTVAISHPVVEYICTLDIDRCARTQSDIARPRVSTRHVPRDPYQGLLAAIFGNYETLRNRKRKSTRVSLHGIDRSCCSRYVDVVRTIKDLTEEIIVDIEKFLDSNFSFFFIL